MQALVYIFIGLAAVAIGATVYFGLTSTLANAILAAVVFTCVCAILVERTLRQRAEARLEKAVEDLSRLLATDAKAGTVLGQRINALMDINADKRLENVEADISVLGTVVRQVAEAVAEVESKITPAKPLVSAPVSAAEPIPALSEASEPSVPLEVVREAIEKKHLSFHIQPIVTLPQRRLHGYDLVPRLVLGKDEFVECADFLPQSGANDVLQQVDAAGLVEAVALSRRLRTEGQILKLYVPLSRATLENAEAVGQMMSVLDANRAIVADLIFILSASDWQAMGATERSVADALVKKGVAFSLARIASLRVDVADMAALGVCSLRVDVALFINTPEALTDYHISDITGYVGRFDVALIAINIASERQIVELLEDGVTLAQGSYIAKSAPIENETLREPRR